MTAFLDFFITAIGSLVSMLFSWDLFSGISVGDFLVAIMVVVILIGALRLRVRD